MTDEKPVVEKLEPIPNFEGIEPSQCPHIGIRQHDSGYYFPLERRDVGIRCDDCGLEWDIEIKKGLGGATIQLRHKLEDKTK